MIWWSVAGGRARRGGVDRSVSRARRARGFGRLGLVGGGFERICIGGWVARVSRARTFSLISSRWRVIPSRACAASARRLDGGAKSWDDRKHDEQDETEDVSPGLLRLALRERRGGRRDEHRDERARVTRLTNVRDGRGRRDARTGVKGLTGRGALAAHSTGTGARPTFVNGTAKKYFRSAAPRARQSARPTNIGTVYTRTRARTAARRVAVGSPADCDSPLTSHHRGVRDAPTQDLPNPSRAFVPSRAMTKYESLSISHRRGRLARDERGGARNAKLPNGGFVVGEDGFLRPARPDAAADPAVGDADADAGADASETVCAARRDAEAAEAAAAARKRAETPEETRARLEKESVATARGVADAISYAARGWRTHGWERRGKETVGGGRRGRREGRQAARRRLGVRRVGRRAERQRRRGRG